MFPHERSLVKKLANEPFALIGVNSDRDKQDLLAKNEAEGITWRSFWCGEDGTRGAIPQAWGLRLY